MYNQAELEAISTVEEPQMFIDFKPNKQKKTTQKNKTFKIVSLFSGCGGLDLGFSGNFNFRDRHFDKTKFKIEYSNDIDPAAEYRFELTLKAEKIMDILFSGLHFNGNIDIARIFLFVPYKTPV